MYDLHVMVELADFWQFLVIPTFRIWLFCRPELLSILFYDLKYEWLCILVLNINIVDDIWVVNMRERSTHFSCLFCVIYFRMQFIFIFLLFYCFHCFCLYLLLFLLVCLVFFGVFVLFVWALFWGVFFLFDSFALTTGKRGNISGNGFCLE